jgi:hypothetical protein
MHNPVWVREDPSGAMSTYLREQSAGEILRGTINIYRRNFLQLWAMYLLPTFPIVMLKLEIFQHYQNAFVYLWLANWLLVIPFAAATLTVGVSDICVGNRPSIIRSLRRVFGAILGKLVVTNLLIFLVQAAFFVPMIAAFWGAGNCLVGLAILPASLALALLFQIWWMFAPTVVVLERIFGWTALKRSKGLGKGFYWRNCGVLLLLYVPTLVLVWIVYATLQSQPNHILKVLGVAIEGMLAPLPLIATVLLYYDLRARSEGYDLAMLGQDLRR